MNEWALYLSWEPPYVVHRFAAVKTSVLRRRSNLAKSYPTTLCVSASDNFEDLIGAEVSHEESARLLELTTRKVWVTPKAGKLGHWEYFRDPADSRSVLFDKETT